MRNIHSKTRHEKIIPCYMEAPDGTEVKADVRVDYTVIVKEGLHGDLIAEPRVDYVSAADPDTWDIDYDADTDDLSTEWGWGDNLELSPQSATINYKSHCSVYFKKEGVS